MQKNMRRLIIGLVIVVLCSVSGIAQGVDPEIIKIEPVNNQRVAQIAGMLADKPKGFGDPIQQRETWNKLYRSGQFASLINDADSINSVPFPSLTEEIYLSYYQGKDSETSKHFIMNRRRLLTKLVWAECLTNQGKYMRSILNALNDIAATPSWNFPAEDKNQTNYKGKLFTIGLSSSAYGFEIAQTLYLLNEKLAEPIRKQLLDALYQKVFYPVLAAIKSNNAHGEFTSLTNTGNHNSATLAGVTGAALAAIKDRHERAVFVSIAERYSKNYLLSFTADGYCSEGMNYYAYGFGHYILLREHLWQATNGKIDLLNRPKLGKIAQFVPNMEIINGVFPTISDCEQNIKPNPLVMYYLNKNQGLALPRYDTVYYNQIENITLSNLMYFFSNSASLSNKVAGNTSKKDIRHYFDHAGVLTVRPSTVSEGSIGATFKGGHNNEHHNHNDVGSYTIVVGDELLMGDPGLATYTPKYFSKERYDLYKTTASFGHPVPLIAATQQRSGRDAEAIIIKADFSEAMDVFAMDITSAYQVSELKKIIRTFVYERHEKGILQVSDTFSFTTPQFFESAFITRFGWKRISEKDIVIIGKKHSLHIMVDATGPIQWHEKVIDEGPTPYTRIAVRFRDKVATGRMSVTFTPSL